MFARPIQVLLVLLVLGLVSAFSYWGSLSFKSSTLSNGASFEPVECWFENDSAVRTECGYMTTRHPSGGASFELPVVVMRTSFWKNSASPMLHIAGGPGGAAYIDAETMPYWLQNFKAQNWGVDFVLYDQRGSGLSQPFLDCPGSQKAQLKSLMMPLTASQDSIRFADQMHFCYGALSKQVSISNHVDLVGTQFSADDIADLSELLEVEQWVLMGVSYGTRLALEFVERFPDLVHSLVLDSVYPPEFDGFETMLENGFRGVEKLLMACEQDLACDEKFPDLAGQLQRSLSLLVKSPLQIRVPRESSSLANQSILLTAHRLIALIDYSSYDSELFAEIPAAIFAVANNEGNNASLLKLASNYLEIELFTQFSEPVFMMTECNENGRFDMSLLRERLQSYIVDYPMLDWSAQGIFNPLVCKGWRKNHNQEFKPIRELVKTEKPTLILSGRFDSITPSKWAKHLSKRLPNSRYLEFPSLGHSVLSSSLCSNDEVQIFLNPSIEKTAFCNQKERLKELSNIRVDWTGLSD